MKVLVACEESQEVCMAFRERGHEAYSCDIQHCALYNHLEYHIVEDVRLLLDGNCEFSTADGIRHKIEKWDLIIAHPPCTYLSRTTAMLLFNKDHTIRDQRRLDEGWKARDFFVACLNANAKKKAIENPVPLRIWGLPPWSQIIEPYMFGEPWKKKTRLWLIGLPRLQPTRVVEPTGLWVGTSSGRGRKSKYTLSGNRSSKKRAKTFHGIAQAMAEQWGE